MPRRFLTWLIILLLVSLSAWGQPGDLIPPGPPVYTPTRLVKAGAVVPPPGVAQHRFVLQPGWNAVSFPFAQVAGAHGFDFGLLAPGSTDARPVELGALEFGRAYWAYSDRPGEAIAWGRPQVSASTLALQPGWNFVGSPYLTAIPLSQLTLGDGTQVNRIWEEVVPRWLYPKAFSPTTPGKWSEIGLEYPGDAEFRPGQSYWIRAEKGVTLRFNAEAEIPRIESFVRDPNGKWIVEGSNFGTRESSRLVLDNHIASNLEISEWTPKRITLTIPPALVPHQVAIISGGAASGRIPRTLWRAPSPVGSGLNIRVLNEAQEPVPNATVTIDGYLSQTTDRRGNVWFEAMEPGTHKVRIRRADYLVLNTQLKMPAQSSHRTTATLYSPRSSLSVRATPCDDGFRPVRIELYQKTDFRIRYLNTWYYEQATPFVELDWNSIPTNVVYRIEITWQDRQGLERLLRVERKLGTYGLQETFFNFWAHY